MTVEIIDSNSTNPLSSLEREIVDIPDYFLILGGFLLVLAILLLYLLFRRIQREVMEGSRISALMSRSRSMKDYLERFDEFDAELSILRNRLADIEARLKNLEKEESKND